MVSSNGIAYKMLVTFFSINDDHCLPRVHQKRTGTQHLHGKQVLMALYSDTSYRISRLWQNRNDHHSGHDARE